MRSYVNSTTSAKEKHGSGERAYAAFAVRDRFQTQALGTICQQGRLCAGSLLSSSGSIGHALGAGMRCIDGIVVDVTAAAPRVSAPVCARCITNSCCLVLGIHHGQAGDTNTEILSHMRLFGLVTIAGEAAKRSSSPAGAIWHVPDN